VDHYAIILSGEDEVPVDVVRHAYLHFLLDQLPLKYSHVVIVKIPLFEVAAKAPRLAEDLKDDYFAWFSECTVRAVEMKLKKLSPGERDETLDRNDADGYVAVRPIFRELTNYEHAEPSMKLYFPDLVRAIDLKVEQPRVASIKFAEAPDEAQASKLSNEEITRRKKLAPTTVPNDQDAIAALTEGERRLAEKNPRAAEISFKHVLEKYPDQTRAWYGLGMVAVLDHDAVRAKEVFGRLTVGEHAALADPMVMAWSHVYLARILEDEGQLDRAKAEYQAVMTLQGAPSQAQQAAQKGLGDLDLRKTTDRP
jgi:tetratricopeptide (TPR) repeat protein